MNKKLSIFLVVLFASCLSPVMGAGGLFDLLETMTGGSTSKEKFRVKFIEGDQTAEDEILLIKVSGIIQETEERDEFNPLDMKTSLMDSMQKDLEVAVGRSQVKAVLLEIDSPGGEVTASDIIHHWLTKFKKTKKPVYALIKMLGASGGYYIACAADQIWAHPTTIVGSIGVIIQTANVEKLADIVGFKSVILKSERTPKKDVMSPFRKMTPEEEKMLLTLVNSMYDRFVKIVADGRNKKIEEVVPLADGSIYTAEQALGNGLIDGIGYRDDVMEKIKTKAALKSAKLVKRKTKKGFADFLAELTETKFSGPSMNFQLEGFLQRLDTPKFLYQWTIGR